MAMARALISPIRLIDCHRCHHSLPAIISLRLRPFCIDGVQTVTTKRGYPIITISSYSSSSSQFQYQVTTPTPTLSRLLSSSSNQIHVWEQTISSANANNASSPETSTGKGTIQCSHKGRILYRPVDSLTHDGKHSHSGWEEVFCNAVDVIPSSFDNKVVSPSSTPALSSLSQSWNSLIRGDLTNVVIRTIPFLHHFLPARYPHSVCSSYSSYALYCFLGSIAGSAGMVLSTQALLVAVGVGTQSAMPMAAALNWVMKDGVGQLGGVLFASQLGSGGIDWDYWRNRFRDRKHHLSQPMMMTTMTMTTNKKRSIRGGGNFQQGTADSNPKRWRMVAAMALDISTLLEICTPLMGPEWFLPCASVATIGKNVGFLAASASRAAIHQSLSMGGGGGGGIGGSTPTTKTKLDENLAPSQKRIMTSATTSSSNLGDVTAKAGSQSIVASLLGTALGIFLSQTFCSDHGTVGILAGFVVLSAVHQVCTYQAVKVVPIRSLDRHRLHIVLTEYISNNMEVGGASSSSNISNNEEHIINCVNNGELMQRTLTPEQVAEKESFLPMMPPDDSSRWLSIGDSLMNICPSGVIELEALLLPVLRTDESRTKQKIELDFGMQDYEKYILKVSPPSDAITVDGLVQLTFLEGATDEDILRGMFHSYAAHAMMKSRHLDITSSLDLMGHAILREAHYKMASEMSLFINNLQNGGWQIGTGFVNVECGSSHRLTIGNS